MRRSPSLKCGLGGFHGGTHPIEKTLDQKSVISVVSLTEQIMSKYAHWNVHEIPL